MRGPAISPKEDTCLGVTQALEAQERLSAGVTRGITYLNTASCGSNDTQECYSDCMKILATVILYLGC